MDQRKRESRSKSTQCDAEVSTYSPRLSELSQHCGSGLFRGTVRCVNEQATLLTIPEVADTLGLTLNQVRRLIEDRYLAAVRVNNVQKVPAEFVFQGSTVPGLRGTIMLLEDIGFSNEEAIDWVLTPNGELGETPIAALQKGHKAPVRRIIQVLA